MKKVIIFTTMILFVFVLQSCQQKIEESIVNENNKKNIAINVDVCVENGILFFKNEEHLIKVLKKFSQMTEKEYIDWCNNNNFNSLEKLYIEAMHSQAEYNNIFTEESKIIPNQPKNSGLMKKMIDSGVIIEEENNEGTNYKLPLDNIALAFVVNKDRIVSINGDLYQYNNENVKIIKNNDFSKIKYLKTINSTNQDQSIIFWDKSQKYSYYYNYYDTNYYYGNKRRIKQKLHVRSEQLNNDGKYYLIFIHDITHQKRGFFDGKWYNNTAYFRFYNTNWFSVVYTLADGTTVPPLTNFIDRPGGTSYKTEFVHRIYLQGSYGAQLQDYIHMPHIYSGEIKFYVEDLNNSLTFTCRPDEKFLIK